MTQSEPSTTTLPLPTQAAPGPRSGELAERTGEHSAELAERTSEHFVVCGDNPLAVRLVETIITQYERPVVAIVQPGRNKWSTRIRQMADVRVVTADTLDRTAFENAALDRAEAIAFVNQDDAVNVEAALLAQEIKPDLRIVMRMGKESLGERINALLPNTVALSASAIAAPSFVASAIGRAQTPPITVANLTVEAVRRERTRPEDVLVGLAVMGESGQVPEVLPADADERADLVLARTEPAPPPRPPRTSSYGLVLSLLFGRRMRTVVAIFFGLYVLGALALVASRSAQVGWLDRETWGDAFYGAIITALSGNPEGDFPGLAARAAIVLLTVVSIGIIPAITATAVDALVQVRLQREAGGLYDPVSDHTVVIGLGDLGTRIVRALHNQGIDVVAIEKEPNRPGVQVARDLKIPVIIGDGSRPETLDRASIATAQALVVASTDDVTNLETGTLALARRPGLRVVLRLFDSDFADRVRRAFNIHTSRSVSYLAAPAFAAALIGRAVLATIPIRRRVMLLAEIPVGRNSLLEHRTVADVNVPLDSRLLAVRTGDDQVVWRPGEGRPIRSGEKLIVVATRTALSHLLAQSRTDSAGERAPYGLLQPWELPQQRPGGPVSGGSTGPA